MADEAIPAATLIVVRDRAERAPELLMVERAEGMAFAAGALVFPGGRIDDADRRHGEEAGLADGPARIAAIRETVEETAIAVGFYPCPSHWAPAGCSRTCLPTVRWARSCWNGVCTSILRR